MRSHWLLAALVLSLATAFLQSEALADFWYWRYPWFDVPMHYLGGLAVASLVVALLERYRPLLFIVLFVLAVVAWELFEFVFGIPRAANYVFDTSVDFLVGALGALTVYAIARYSIWRSR